MVLRVMLATLSVIGAAAVGFDMGRRFAPRGDPGAGGGPSTMTATATSSLTSVPLVPALAALGPGVVACADGSGRVFVLSGGLDGHAPLRLEGAYVLREARARDLIDPDHRSPSGFYVDDLGREGAATIVAARANLETELASSSLDPEVAERALSKARSLLEAGDATLLVTGLTSHDYRTRRTAALALGEWGFVAAAPTLLEVVEAEPGTPGGAQARELLAHVAGRPIANRAELTAWWDSLPARERVGRR